MPASFPTDQTGSSIPSGQIDAKHIRSVAGEKRCSHRQVFNQEIYGSWRDFMATAALVRPWLGISPSAWEEAIEAFGPEDAAVVLAAILQRSSLINSAGGYLRNLTEKARAGAFSLGPMLMALIRANLRKGSQKMRA